MVDGDHPGDQDEFLNTGERAAESSSDNEPGPSFSVNLSRPALLQRSTSTREPPKWSSALDSLSPQPSMFSLPHRSIFSSGLPTSSVSASTAQASMSSPQLASSFHPLSTLSSSSANSARRVARNPSGSLAQRRTRSSRVQKHTDDPSASIEDGSLPRRIGSRPTSLAVTNLFAATDLVGSRSTSFVHPSPASQYIRSSTDSSLALPSHLYVRGLVDGRHSDITVHCFGTSYALHRLLLDRAPFFCSALSEPWFESTAKEITLHPEEMDPNISRTAFELALRRIYGCADPEEEDKHSIGLFATGCWLEMSDLIETSISSILKQLAPSNLANCIKFVTGSYYGNHGERILTAAKAMLCREGYEMLLKNFNGISGELIKETISSDAFYVPGEWERWNLAKKILNRRIRAQALNLGLIHPDNSVKGPRPRTPPYILRDYTGYDAEPGSDTNIWTQLYADPDISPLYELLDRGIHYMHMSFEQLQQIKVEKDVLRIIPLVTDNVISNALWQSMLLRQKIINATEGDVELGFTQIVEKRDTVPIDTLAHDLDQETLAKRSTNQQGDDDDIGVENSNENPVELKFWIPCSDSTYQMGSGPDCIVDSTSNKLSKNKSTRTQSSEQVDATESSIFSGGLEDVSTKVGNCPGPKLLYTAFPPFRFAAEFPPTKSLKENKRVYSSTVWYAGSLWNVYIQKKETSKSTQLGIYLHREKHVDGAEDFMRNVANNNNVDERISSIEKELYLRQRTRRRLNETLTRPLGDSTDFYSDLLRARMPPDIDTISGVFRPRQHAPFKSSEGAGAQEQPLNTSGAFDDDTDESKTLGYTIRKPALPPYVDSRSTIKTYFKIYAPSRGGRMISVYESAPDQFNFSQSWGWKSSNLVVDDASETTDDGSSPNEPRLRFMVVIGNV